MSDEHPISVRSPLTHRGSCLTNHTPKTPLPFYTIKSGTNETLVKNHCAAARRKGFELYLMLALSAIFPKEFETLLAPQQQQQKKRFLWEALLNILFGELSFLPFLQFWLR
jgi:hypothetical protein